MSIWGISQQDLARDNDKRRLMQAAYDAIENWSDTEVEDNFKNGILAQSCQGTNCANKLNLNANNEVTTGSGVVNDDSLASRYMKNVNSAGPSSAGSSGSSSSQGSKSTG